MTPMEQLEQRLKEEQEVILSLLATDNLPLAMNIIKGVLMRFEIATQNYSNVTIVLEDGKIDSVYRSEKKAQEYVAFMRRYNEEGHSYSLLTEELCD